jgi:AcrR family transcriptional regulator
MALMARPRAQDYTAKRDVILSRAADLFAQFGYSATSISMIAGACGVSKALLYHYYPDKEALLFDLLSVHLQQLVAVVEAAPGRGADKLHAMSGALLEAYRDADAQHQVQISSLKRLGVERQEALRRLERRLVDLFAAALAEALPHLADSPLLKPVTMSLFGMLNWHYLWFREGKGLSRSDYARLATSLLLNGAEAGLARA